MTVTRCRQAERLHAMHTYTSILLCAACVGTPTGADTPCCTARGTGYIHAIRVRFGSYATPRMGYSAHTLRAYSTTYCSCVRHVGITGPTQGVDSLSLSLARSQLSMGGCGGLAAAASAEGAQPERRSAGVGRYVGRCAGSGGWQGSQVAASRAKLRGRPQALSMCRGQCPKLIDLPRLRPYVMRGAPRGRRCGTHAESMRRG